MDRSRRHPFILPRPKNAPQPRQKEPRRQRFAHPRRHPPEVFLYRLGNRSAVDWVIDQYQITEDKRSGIKSDPNREDDPDYIVRLVGQVVRVSVETVAIVNSLPKNYA
ncbi:MAG TPA: type ISP restriction/modification enzyme [Planctomycetota bacterium]|nr:type ISP restriction/modification enzyme [Planctomycetota bacterium]